MSVPKLSTLSKTDQCLQHSHHLPGTPFLYQKLINVYSIPTTCLVPPSHPPSPLLTPWKLLYSSLVLQWTSGPCPFHLNTSGGASNMLWHTNRHADVCRDTWTDWRNVIMHRPDASPKAASQLGVRSIGPEASEDSVCRAGCVRGHNWQPMIVQHDAGRRGAQTRAC